MTVRVLPLAEVEALEANAIAHGVAVDTLMEHAGQAVAEEAARHLPAPPAAVGVVCGLGNNGGDGLAAVTFLIAEGFQPRVWLLDDPTNIRTAAAFRRWELVKGLRYTRVGVPTAADLRSLPLVIDAMLGTGARGDLREPYRSAVREVAASGVPVLSIDLPTGLGTLTPLRAKWTVALEVGKQGMDDPSCGEVMVRSIGVPPEAHRETGPGEFALFPRPGPRTRKSDSGRVVVVGGGPYAGAPYLAGMAALRAGADMVFVLVPGGVANVVQGFSPQLMVRGIGKGPSFAAEDAAPLAEAVMALGPTAVLVGNGLGIEASATAAASAVIERSLPRTPVVVDADGLRALSSRSGHLFPGQTPSGLLLTPNRREFHHLVEDPTHAREEPSEEEVLATAHLHRATLLVKGPEDMITDGDEFRLNRVHPSAMVVGGAGDVLAGVATSLVARGLSPFLAARLATIWLGRTASDVFDANSYSVLPQDLIDGLGRGLRRGLDDLRRLTDPGRAPRKGQE